MRRRTFFGLMASFATMCVALPSLAAADAVEDFYKGRTITVIVPFSPGGTSSRFGDLIGRHFAKHVPGQPDLVFEYMPGGGGIVALNHVYARAARDGTELHMPDSSTPLNQLLQPDVVEYDAREFNWLGVVSQVHTVLVVREDTGFKTLDDLKEKEVFIGSSGAGSETDMYPRMTNQLIGTKFNVLPGYTGGGSEIMPALESGEIDGSARTWTAWSQRMDLFDGNIVEPVLTYGRGRAPGLPDVPNLEELVQTDDDKSVVRLVSSIGPLGYGLGTPPGVPEEIVTALRKAFSDMIQDPEFKADAEKSGLPINEPLSGEEAQALVVEALDTPPELVERAKQLIAIPN
jgi:tripartite-type tricarboxylate transporter receptor subunit TctC